MRQCPWCGRPIDDQATACPYVDCGRMLGPSEYPERIPPRSPVLGSSIGEMSIVSPPPPGSRAGEMRLQSPPPPGSYAGEMPIASPPPPGSRAGEMRLQSPRPGIFARLPELAVRSAPALPSGACGEPLSQEDAIVLSVHVEKLIQRLQLDRRRRVALATTASAFLAFVALCWTVYCVHGRMGYAELTSDVELRVDPLDPECVVLTYLPVTTGQLIFRRTGAERATDFRNEVSAEDIGCEQVVLWRVDGLGSGETVAIRYRSGWRLVTHELPVSRADPGP